MSSESIGVRTVRALMAAARLRCPVCGVGRLFRGWFRMATACPACEATFEREEGFFQGAIYLGYAATLASGICVYALLAWGLGASHPAVSASVLAFTIAIPFLAWRWARAGWLAVDQIVDPRLPGRPPQGERAPGQAPQRPTTPRRSRS
jgi:uncharacterized protein (DUF983 family)